MIVPENNIPNRKFHVIEIMLCWMNLAPSAGQWEICTQTYNPRCQVRGQEGKIHPEHQYT
jgi:hypothetical protein